MFFRGYQAPAKTSYPTPDLSFVKTTTMLGNPLRTIH